ncbi:MAG: molybdenum cofactor guanylyltransferase [Acidobacteria bacterium]|nr:molybdenum cofactor guanylyltransferase [Acidobacteriota bacterium]MBI3664066.1 molybdenum cofactor guanylyltransferase [Acidobacteriota bacterium]
MTAAKFQNVSAFILAGGSSSRMGADKALLELAGQPLLLRTARLLDAFVTPVTVIGDPSLYASLGLPVFPDDVPGLGPLGGIATALRISRMPWNLVVACDLPYLTAAWIDFLISRALAAHADALLPASERGPEPLCAMYHARCAPVISTALARGVRKVTDGLAGVVIETLPHEEWKAFDSGGGLFKNMNSPADYAGARAHFEGKTPS